MAKFLKMLLNKYSKRYGCCFLIHFTRTFKTVLEKCLKMHCIGSCHWEQIGCFFSVLSCISYALIDLVCCCVGGFVEVVQLLVAHGADVHGEDNRHVSCIMIAFRKAHVKVIKVLVRHVTQFPPDQDCLRYIATLTDKVWFSSLTSLKRFRETVSDKRRSTSGHWSAGFRHSVGFLGKPSQKNH